MGSLLDGLVLFVEHDTGLLQSQFDVVEIRVLVGDCLQSVLTNLGCRTLFAVVAVSRPLPKRDKFGLQTLNAACGMVGDLLGGVSLLLRTGQLLAQVGLLLLCTR
ncbi:hypothetical protein ACFUCH_20670 [Streptomyces olivaceus]|uniref:hypothetical protein n=1 Tax=Streptomyces olivaceus TaxID=47716 RepID=UPI0036349EA8